MELEKSTVQGMVRNAMQKLNYKAIKDEELEIVEGMMNRRDMFAILPTGFGKTLCFAVLPVMYDELLPMDEPSIVIVITPLIAKIKDQVERLSARGLKTCYIAGDQNDKEIKAGVVGGEYQLVFFTPEVLLGKRQWRRVLLDKVYSRRLRACVVDDAHTIKKWGETYHSVLTHIHELRNLLPPKVNLMALTAITTTKLRLEVTRMLGLGNEIVVSLSPCRDNIMYATAPFKTLERTFEPIIAMLRKERRNCPCIIVFCQRIEDTADLYIHFRYKLQADFTEPPGAPDNLQRFRLVDMLHSCLTADLREKILSSITTDSNLRVLFTTAAFGVGMDCSDVRQVIHLGPPNDLESYVQQAGYAGHDGKPSLSLLLRKMKRGRYIDRCVSDYISNDSVCRRDTLFANFDCYTRSFSGPLCLCCDICSKTCTCSSCSENVKSFVFC